MLDLGGVQVIATTYTAVGNDPIYAEVLGIDLAEIRTIVVKVRSSFPVAYDEFVDPENMLFVDTPGRTSPILDRMPFERLPRPCTRSRPTSPGRTRWRRPDTRSTTRDRVPRRYFSM